jgi:membrane protein YqaA with SNARE-associated domain
MLRFFLRLGIFGLFLLSALDSSFLVLPFGNDLLLIALVNRNRDSLIWIVYVLVSALGSIVGVFVIDVIMRKAGEKGLERFFSAKRSRSSRRRLKTRRACRCS